MKPIGLILGMVVVVLSNGVVLIQSAANRSGPPVQAITLTERELPILPRDLDDSSVSLHLRWRAQASEAASKPGPVDPPFDAAKLQELGFDCTIPANPAEARPPVLTVVYVALEYGGGTGAGPTQLILADASRNQEALRAKYPDPQKHLIVRAVVRVLFEWGQDLRTGSERPHRWIGYLEEILPGAIYVPQPFARELNRLKPRSGEAPRYSVTLHYGRNLEPWVASVTVF